MKSKLLGGLAVVAFSVSANLAQAQLGSFDLTYSIITQDYAPVGVGTVLVSGALDVTTLEAAYRLPVGGILGLSLEPFFGTVLSVDNTTPSLSNVSGSSYGVRGRYAFPGAGAISYASYFEYRFLDYTGEDSLGREWDAFTDGYEFGATVDYRLTQNLSVNTYAGVGSGTSDLSIGTGNGITDITTTRIGFGINYGF